MEPFDTTAGIAGAILLVLVNGFFVAAEFAMVKVRGTQLQPLAQHSARARLAVQITHRLDSYLAACQVGVTLSSLGLGWIGEPSVAGLLEPPFAALVGGFAPALSRDVSLRDDAERPGECGRRLDRPEARDCRGYRAFDRRARVDPRRRQHGR